MYIDTHCHLDFPDYDGDRAAVLESAAKAGVKTQISICTTTNNADAVRALSAANPSVYHSAGIHPCHVDEGLFSLEELVEKFDLNRVHKAGAKFDPEKNKWFNHQYLQKQSDESLAEIFEKDIVKKLGKCDFSFVQMTKITSLIKERANFVSEFWELSNFFFELHIV